MIWGSYLVPDCTSGMGIVRAIAEGERDAQRLLAHVRAGVKAPTDELLKSLQGTWQPQFIFELRQLLQSYDASTRQIGDFKQAANAIGRCKKHPLKPFFHSVQKKMGWNGAVTATVRKRAVSYYNMITKGL